MLRILTAFLVVTTPLFAAENSSALTAIKLLPRGQSKLLARIEARDGKPAPDRWHILVHDKETDTGVHEFVVAGGEVVASREISQFAEKLTPEDVISADAVKVDSDRAAKLLQQYAHANNVTIATVNYELKKDGAEAAPLWRVTGLDESGAEVGSLVLTAGKGTVIAHEGFPVQPAAPQEKKEAFRPQASSQVASIEPIMEETDSSSPGKKSGRSRRSDDDDRPNFFRRAGGSVQKFFTGRDTISR